MPARNKTIRVHKFLRLLFGDVTTTFDVLAILLGSCILTIYIWLQTYDTGISTGLRALLLLLAIDPGGGVVANFSSGTTCFYANDPKRQFSFLAFHVVQPLLLIIVFPNEMGSIFISAGLILFSSAAVVLLTNHYEQRVVAAMLFLLCASLTAYSPFRERMVSFLIILFALKLVLAFPVNWISHKNS